MGWLSMFVLWGFMVGMEGKESGWVIRYREGGIVEVWKVIGRVFVVRVVMMCLVGLE